MILALFAGVVQAQQGTSTPRPTPTNVPNGGESNPTPEPGSGETKGSIRGTVYQDLNADGACSSEPTLAGVPIKFVSDQGDTVFLQSGANGTYGLVAAGLGTWTVTAEPGAGMIVTSQNPLQVFLGVDNTLALNVNFCIADGSIVIDGDIPLEEGTVNSGSSSGPKGPTGGPASGGTGTLFLPTAGAGLAPTLIVTGLSGASLILAGFGIEMRRRRENQLDSKPKSKRENKA
jgi:hypothetical protein